MGISRGLLLFDRRDPRLHELPDEVAIEIVMGCNLRCPMCPVSGLPSSMNGRRATMMDADVYRRVVEQISDRPRSILLNVFGESTLHPDLIEFIRIAKAPGHHVALFTNGTKLTRTYSANVIEAGLDALTVSIDGLQDDTYRGMRVGANRSAVLRNLRGLVAENAARGNWLRIEINYILSSSTGPEASAFHQEFRPLVAAINLTPVTDFGSHWSLPDGMPEDGADPRLVARAPRLQSRTPCPHLWRALWVSAEGRVMLCTNDFKQYSALPTVQQRPLRDIWREDVGRIRRAQVEGCFDKEPCRSCRLNDVHTVATTDDRRIAFAHARRQQLMEAIVPLAWLPRRLKRRWAIRDRAVGWVDAPSANATVAGLVIVNGWAVARAGRTVERVEVRIDGTTRGLARYDQFRPDVGEVHPGDGHSFSGFSYPLETRGLSNGPHQLDALVHDSRAQRVALASRTIRVEN